jgi:hypothetical protein
MARQQRHLIRGILVAPMSKLAREEAVDQLDRLYAMRVANAARGLPLHVKRCEWAIRTLIEVLQGPRTRWTRLKKMRQLETRLRRIEKLGDFAADKDTKAVDLEASGLTHQWWNLHEALFQQRLTPCIDRQMVWPSPILPEFDSRYAAEIGWTDQRFWPVKGVIKVRPRDHYVYFEYACPACGERHSHGWDPKRRTRLSHCGGGHGFELLMTPTNRPPKEPGSSGGGKL